MIAENIVADPKSRGASEGNRASSYRASRRRAYILLLTVDLGTLALSGAIASLLRFGTAAVAEPWILFAVLAPLFLLLILNSNAYRPESLGNWRHGIAPSLGALYQATAVVIFVSFCLKSSTDISRLLLVGIVLADTILLPVGRLLVGHWTNWLFRGAPLSRVVLCDGVAPPSETGGATIYDADLLGLSHSRVDPSLLDRFGKVFRDVDAVIVACPPARREFWTSVLRGASVYGELLLPELDAIGGLSLSRFGGVATITVSTGPLRQRDRVMKRCLDLLLGCIALIALAPLLMLVAIAVKLDSRGPVIFRQQRIGYQSKLFEVFKFRSMRVESSDLHGARSATRDDDRVTRIGRFIRATSIDELPQLFNILRGDMSFVGPRPHALGSTVEDQLFWEVDIRYLDRHACQPGLTGLAQVRGFRGATHRREDLLNRLQADLEYLAGWSVLRDISILFSTIRVVVHRNAF